jgi:hypothetical protein
MSKINAVETMSILLGSKYQILSNGTMDPVVLAKLPDEDGAIPPRNMSGGIERISGETKYEFRTENLAPKNSSIAVNDKHPESASLIPDQMPMKTEKTTDDYLFQFYLGSLTVVGLFVLFRMIQKSR